MTENEKKGNELDSWDGFLGSNFLGVDDIKSDTDAVVVIQVEMDTENHRPMLVMQLNGITYKKSLNVTDSKFLNEAKIKSPNDLIGRKLFFRKSMAYSPSAKKDVATLRILKIE